MVFFAGVPAEPDTANICEETAVNSENVRQEDVQEEPVGEQKASQVQDDSLPTPSDHQLDTSSNVVDMTASEPTFSEIQQVSEPSEPTVDKDAQDGHDNVTTDSATDVDMGGSYSRAQSDDVSEDNNISNNNTNNVVAEPGTDDVVENDGQKTPTADQVDQDTSTTEPDGVGGTVDDGKVDAEDSGGDDMSEEQFLSPAASEADIVGSFTPTKEQPGTCCN